MTLFFAISFGWNNFLIVSGIIFYQKKNNKKNDIPFFHLQPKKFVKASSMMTFFYRDFQKFLLTLFDAGLVTTV